MFNRIKRVNYLYRYLMCYDLDVKNFEIACSGLPSKNGDKILLARRIYYLLVSLILGLFERC